MIGNILKKVFGSRNSRLIKEYSSIVKKINDLEKALEKNRQRAEVFNCGAQAKISGIQEFG